MDKKQTPVNAQTLFQNSRSSLLLVVIFTVINIGLVLFGEGTRFMFSAEFPYFISVVPWIVAEEGTVIGFADVLPYALIGLVLLVPYFLAWFFSKNKRGWLLFAVIYFALDTAMMLLLDFSLFNLIFHVWVLVDLSRGLKKPAEEAQNAPMSDDGVITPDDVMAEVNQEEKKSDTDSFYDGF